jgi:hypothetical protein
MKWLRWESGGGKPQKYFKLVWDWLGESKGFVNMELNSKRTRQVSRSIQTLPELFVKLPTTRMSVIIRSQTETALLAGFKAGNDGPLNRKLLCEIKKMQNVLSRPSASNRKKA